MLAIDLGREALARVELARHRADRLVGEPARHVANLRLLLGEPHPAPPCAAPRPAPGSIAERRQVCNGIAHPTCGFFGLVPSRPDASA